MTKKIKIFSALIVCVFLVVVLMANKTLKTKVSKSQIIIGAVLPLTGKAAPFGEQTRNGMELAVENIQKSNGIAPKIIYEDSQTETTNAVNACQKLISVDRVPAIVGLVPSNEALGCAPLADPAKVIMVSTLASADKIKDAGDYVFRVRESGTAHSKIMADYAVNEKKLITAALLYANTESGNNYASGFKGAFEALGGKIVAAESFAEKTEDFRSNLSKVKAAVPQVVYLAALPPDAGAILRQAHELGIKALFVASPTAAAMDTIATARGTAEGLVVSTPAFNPGSGEEKISQFVNEYKTKFDKEPDFAAANAHDAIELLSPLLAKYGAYTVAIKNALYQTARYPGIGGMFSFDRNGEVTKSVFIEKVKDGKFVVVR